MIKCNQDRFDASGRQISTSSQIQRAKASHARIMRENAKESLDWELFFANLCNSEKEARDTLSSLARPWQGWGSRRLAGSKLSPPVPDFSPAETILHLDFRLDYNLWWVLGSWELQLHPLFEYCICVCSMSYVHCMSCPVLKVSLLDHVSKLQEPLLELINAEFKIWNMFRGSKWSQKWPILVY